MGVGLLHRKRSAILSSVSLDNKYSLANVFSKVISAALKSAIKRSGSFSLQLLKRNVLMMSNKRNILLVFMFFIFKN